MTFIISKDFFFSTPHYGAVVSHFKVTAELAADDLNGVGFVRDYGELKPLASLIKSYDGRAYDDAFPKEIVTPHELGAVLTDYFRESLPELVSIRVIAVDAVPPANEFHFSASHILMGLPEGHQCGRLHGHNYVVRVFADHGADLTPIKMHIDGALDHRHLNDVYPVMQPSAENIANAMFRSFKPLIPSLSGIAVSETPKTWATYRE